MLSRLGLRSRLVLLMLAALLPVFGLFAWSSAKNQQTVLTLAQAGLQSQALLAAAHQQRLVERAAQLLGDIASGPSIKDTRNRLCVQYLKNLQSQDTAYSNLGVVDLNGKLSCHAASPDDDIYVGDRTFFTSALEQRAFSVGDYAISRSTGRPGVAFGMPVYSAGGVLNGVAFTAVDLMKFAEALATEKIMEGAQLRVIDRQGTVLASHPATGLAGSREQDSVVLDAARLFLPGVGQATDGSGVEQVYAYAPVGGSGGGLFVALSVPRAILVATPRTLLMADLVALLGMAALGMACAWAMGQRLVVNPANAILKEANEIARGNFLACVSLGVSPQNEIGQLALAFNRMAASLQAQRSELDAALHQADAERAMLDLILNSMSEGVIAIDTQGRFLLFNQTAGKLFPAPAEDALFSDWRHDNPLKSLDGSTLHSNGPLMQTLAGARIDNRDMRLSRVGAHDRILRMSTRPLFGAARRQVGALAVFVDVTDLRAAESFALAQEEVLVLIAGGAPVRESIEAILRLIESSAPHSLCSMLMSQGGQLCQAIAPSLPPAFIQATEGLRIAEGMGACGTAAFRRESVIVEDVTCDPLMQGFRNLLATHGLRACWSTPVMATDGEVLATFAIYRRTPGRPQPADQLLIGAAIRLTRLALERARAEQALVGSEARFRELADNVEDVFYNVDARQGRVRYVSPGYEKVWGRSCESLYATPGSLVDAVLPEDLPVLALANALNDAGKNASVEYRIRPPDGRIRWLRDRSYPVSNDAGELERVVGTIRDITDSKLAELALAATHRALEMLSRSGIAINRIHDEAALLAEVCRVAVEVGGYRMAWVGFANDDEEKTIQPVAHAGAEQGYLETIRLYWRDDRPEGKGPAGRAIRTGLPQKTEDVSRLDSGFHWRAAAVQRGYCSTLALPLCSKEHSFGVLCLYAGELQRFTSEEVQLLQELADNLAFGIVSLRTRLEQQRSEAAERKTAARLHEQASLIDLAPGAIVVRNLDLSIRLWSKGAERLYGWPAEQVLGKTMQTLMYRDPQVLTAAIEQIKAAEGYWTGEVAQVACDGSPVYVEMRGTVVRDVSGQVNGVMIVNTDIRERRQAREEILLLNASLEDRVQQRTAQLKFANEQLEAFSYSVSHDLRSPLSSINGFSNLLAKSITGQGATPMTERSQHYLARIRAGVGQMGELIDAMLSLAHVSRSSLAWETVDLSATAEVLLSALQERDPGRVCRLEVQPGLMAKGDSRLLRQVLYNLLGNAWKFSAGKACTCITLGRMASPDCGDVYSVRDNGAGFDMAYAPKLFGAFQRLHTAAEFAGTGIGLATVQRIVARHGGRVWADSVQGEGATFYFTLGAEAA
ncbi:PAS domain S-box protein [Polaromonas sp. CG_9.11]|uniref:PAS domain S-box protein n=1 Tax=Polaromonas sp. CG_9.11 TaxID=2787730 RepID=UPI0018CA4D5F|nr:PAS domain S-box protein [Polaromonas sp. CG_9.11]MBG6075567.1 PAS domain S-box-containing protein [Polaromonas sp. CG_9.11]